MFEIGLFLFYVIVAIYISKRFNSNESSNNQVNVRINANKESKFVQQEDYIKFGKYKGTYWVSIPSDYLIWLSNNVTGNGKTRAIQELKRRKNAK